MKEIYRGVVKFYNNSRGFGFIDYDNSKSIFFHKSEMIDEVTESDFVNFKISTSNKTGKPVATNVTLIGDKINKSIETIEKKYNITEKIDPQNILKSISENWKLEAKLEKGKDYFFHSAELNQITDRNKCYIIGRKGTGKSSISEYILNLKSYNIFTEKLSFKNFPFNELYSFENQKYTPPNQYITLWKYLIYSTVAKLMVSNENIDSKIRQVLGEIYKPDSIKSLQRTISNWTSAEIGLTVLGTGGTISGSKEKVEKNYSWLQRVNDLEDIIITYCDSSTYYIVFDELDEDYRNIKNEDHHLYNYLLTSLFKAVQDVNNTMSDSVDIKPIVFLRDDIYTLIKDADKNKWRDFKIEIEWNISKIKKLLAHRISVDSNLNIDLEFQDAWFLLFQNSKVYTSGRNVDSFEYITRSTHLRPRDFIRYLQVCSEETVEKGRRYIGGETIKYVDRAFSNYLRDEIVDEVYPLVPEIEEILQIISNNRKWKFSYYEFKKHFEKYHRNKTIKESNYDYVLDILYRFSVLGNEHQSQKNILYFKYFHTNMNLNRSEQLVIHRGLFKALQII